MTPTRFILAGLDHGHVRWWFNRPQRDDLELVGIYEPDRELASTQMRSLGFDPALLSYDLGVLLDEAKPDACAAFGSTLAHLEVVQACAPRGVHVMVEKPMAVSLEHAEQMAALARTHGIHLLTNFATSWFASNRAAYRMVHDEKQIGAVRKVVVHDGHWGPVAIGCGPEFLAWLTDPVRNGGGALMDFGCYGANLMHWLLDGEQPIAVTAVTRNFQPENYPLVDDDATIIVDYPSAQCVIHGSWNWPWHRKDMEIYGTNGAVVAVDPGTLRARIGLQKPEQTTALDPLPTPLDDCFAFLAAVVQGKVVLDEHDLSGLANNLTVMRILDAARESARTGRRVIVDSRE
jgi:predicted dehydrogenase